eukprot:GFYU01005774.1.p1 GENE.GFYU01005774.1~~GFYU01005774.1.p1  ORF type:complete len:450 (+),score=162.73 GFYU01005774.1:166-1350(+)
MSRVEGKGIEYSDDKLVAGVKDVSKAVAAVYPSTTVVPVLGPKDVMQPYNVTCPRNPPFVKMWDAFSDILPLQQEQNVANGAYYVHRLTPKLRALVLNTALWSPKNSNAGNDPCGQMAWLKRQVQLASEKDIDVYIVGHTPPGVKRKEGDDQAEQLWQDRFVCQYVDIIKAHPEAVEAQLFGSLHRDEFRLLETGPNAPPGCESSGAGGGVGSPGLMMNPALSPSESSNPSFRAYVYDKKSASIQDYITYTAPLTDAAAKVAKASGPRFDKDGNLKFIKLYSFTEAFEKGSVGPSVPNTLINELWDGKQDLVNKWMYYRTGAFDVEPTYKNWKPIMCSLRFSDIESYKKCITVVKMEKTKLLVGAQNIPPPKPNPKPAAKDEGSVLNAVAAEEE